ncbi:unnamed protein product, partial [Ectocarpus sp. 12 AP-2014]
MSTTRSTTLFAKSLLPVEDDYITLYFVGRYFVAFISETRRKPHTSCASRAVVYLLVGFRLMATVSYMSSVSSIFQSLCRFSPIHSFCHIFCFGCRTCMCHRFIPVVRHVLPLPCFSIFSLWPDRT